MPAVTESKQYFHVAIETVDSKQKYEYNLSAADVEEGIVKPYLDGTGFYFRGEYQDPFNIKPPRIATTIIPLQPYYWETSDSYWDYSLETFQQIVKDFLNGKTNSGFDSMFNAGSS